MATSSIVKYQEPLAISKCTVYVANNTIMTLAAGEAYAMKISEKTYVVFMTLGITLSDNRGSGLSLFKLMLDGDDLFIREPYTLSAWGTSSGIGITGYNSDARQFITFPHAIPSGVRANVGGVALFDKH